MVLSDSSNHAQWEISDSLKKIVTHENTSSNMYKMELIMTKEDREDEK